MTIRAAILSDLHYAAAPNAAIPSRRGELAAVLLLRAVHRFNRYIKPDVVLVTGDLINFPDAPDAAALSAELRDILALLQMPCIILPGNHDLGSDEFYRIFPRPERFTDIGKVRFVAFYDDPETPGYNAVRPAENIELMRRARHDWQGQLVSVQHVPLVPRGVNPYNYVNADTLLQVFTECGYTASVSGHFHEGLPLLKHGRTALVTAAATCETPFPYCLLDIHDDGGVSSVQETLSLDPALKLKDRHIHTSFAYCNENMSIPMTNTLARAFGLSATVISEHSSHLYFDRPEYLARLFYYRGVAAGNRRRTAEYFEMFEEFAGPDNLLSMEVDFDLHGRPVIEREDWDRLQFRNGAIHALESICAGADYEKVKDNFMFQVESMLKSGIDALVHPFRIFRFNGVSLLPKPSELYKPLALMLKRYGAAAEINFHVNEPEPEFFRICIENGVKISLGSDSHNLYEVGEFYPHLRLLEQIAPGAAAAPETFI